MKTEKKTSNKFLLGEGGGINRGSLENIKHMVNRLLKRNNQKATEKRVIHPPILRERKMSTTRE